MRLLQKQLRLKPYARGCHLITAEILAALPDLSAISVGFCQVFIQHTSASLSINENADPVVRRDMEMALNHIVPEDLAYQHTDEGSDDMPAHVKAALLGAGLLIPVTNGTLGLGGWQGIYLNEHRDCGGPRSLVLTIMGE